jgi:hypothetical protein
MPRVTFASSQRLSLRVPTVKLQRDGSCQNPRIPRNEQIGETTMSKQEEAGLILKLYELRREETLRKARDWYFREFNPESLADFQVAMFSPQSGYLRMVLTYWDMAAALVNDGAIDLKMFTDCNGEHIGVFCKVEPLLPDIRAAYNPAFASQLEKLIDSTPNGRERVAKSKEQMKGIRARMEQMRAAAVTQSQPAS